MKFGINKYAVGSVISIIVSCTVSNASDIPYLEAVCFGSQFQETANERTGRRS